MKFLFIISFLSLYVISINCWVAISPYKPEEFVKNNISDDVHCFSDAYQLNTMNKGEVKPLGKICGIARCNRDRSISLTGCSVVSVEPPCYVGPGDLSKPYPECCFEIICPKDITENKI